MANFFRIKNFEEFQHYRDRTPPWIKLYNSLLDNYQFGQLPDAAKGHLVMIWLLASRHQNRLPWDARWIATRIQAQSKVDLESMARLEFIEPIQEVQTQEDDAGDMLSERKQVACLEREGEKRENSPPPPSGGRVVVFEKFWKAYPKKFSKGQAEKVWKTLNPNEQLTETILQAVERAKKSEKWRKDNGDFIPYPATWLRAKGWEDEYPELRPPTLPRPPILDMAPMSPEQEAAAREARLRSRAELEQKGILR